MLIQFKEISDCFHCNYKWDCYRRQIESKNQPCKNSVEIAEELKRYETWVKRTKLG